MTKAPPEIHMRHACTLISLYTMAKDTAAFLRQRTAWDAQ